METDTLAFNQSPATVCWWCSEPPSVDEALQRLPDPPEHEGQCVGWFCSYQCGFAFLHQWRYAENYITHVQASYMKDHRAPLQRALPPMVMKKFGGTMSVDEYRSYSCDPLSELPLSNTDWSRARFIEIMKKPYDDRMVYLQRLSETKKK